LYKFRAGGGFLSILSLVLAAGRKQFPMRFRASGATGLLSILSLACVLAGRKQFPISEMSRERIGKLMNMVAIGFVVLQLNYLKCTS